MPSIRQRLAEVVLGSDLKTAAEDVLGDEIEKLRKVQSLMYEAYLEGPYEFTPDRLVAALKELDPALIADVIDSIRYDQYFLEGYGPDEDARREKAYKDARRMYIYDPVVTFAIQTWTNYGFGENIEIEPKKPKPENPDEDDTGENAAKEVWDEFFGADRNRAVLGQRHLQNLSNDVLTDGEIFLTFFVAKGDGATTIRLVKTEEITAKVCDPGDSGRVFFYKRVWREGSTQKVMYYPDWLLVMDEKNERDVPTQYTDGEGKPQDIAKLLPDGAERADLVNDGTFVCMMHVAHNRKGGWRGWPITVSSAPWVRTHNKFRADRAAVAAALAQYTDKLRVKGGSRAIDAIMAKLNSTYSSSNLVDTNPPPPAGSVWLENEAVERTRMSLSTGASDAKTDGDSLLQMVGLGMGLYPHWLGSGDAYRLATATSMEGPLLRNFSRYQTFWSSVWADMVRLVLVMKEKYGSASFEGYDSDVSTDRLVEVDAKMVSAVVAETFKNVLTPMSNVSLIDDEVLVQLTGNMVRLILQGLGVSDAGDILEPMLKGELPEPPEEEPGQTPEGEETPEEEEEPEGADLLESHLPVEVIRICPFCRNDRAYQYDGHRGLLVCTSCMKTYNPKVE